MGKFIYIAVNEIMFEPTNSQSAFPYLELLDGSVELK